MSVQIIKDIESMQRLSDGLRSAGHRLVLVPTMGCLHDGHLSLIQAGRRLASRLIVSIFVNPAQFGPNEDFDSYPRTFESDLQKCTEAGVDIVFAPPMQLIYPQDYQTYIALEDLPNHLCGLSRPVFFRGVATVVAKLFNIVKPHIAVFGEKDYQQLLIVKRMVRDLNLDIEIVAGPIVRERDGLAMSSRNTYLSPEQRAQALCLSQALKHARQMVQDGEKRADKIIAAATDLINSHADTEIDYIAICDPQRLTDLALIEQSALMALAVKVGQTRLIDNAVLTLSDKRRA